MTVCNQLEKNQERCTCLSTGCSRHSFCCECVAHHRSNNQLPGCYFSTEQQRSAGFSEMRKFDPDNS